MRTPIRTTSRWVLFLLLLISTVAVARAAVPQLQITGRVVDRANGRPLEAAQVFLPGLAIGTITNADGRYALSVPESRIAGDQIAIRVQLIGYAEASAVVRLRDGAPDSTTVDFALGSTALRLQELVVTGIAADAVGRTARVSGEAPVAPRAVASISMPAPPLAGFDRARDEAWNREQYGHIEENAFRAVMDHPLSTFSVDVDRASYSNLRRFLLRERRLPPIDAVQVEELVNYFPYDYALPRGDDPVAVTTELGQAPWSPQHRLLRVGLAARAIEVADLPPSNLVFLLDVSGSMNAADKLPLVKQSLRLLVDQMREQDYVSLVVYAGAAGLVLEPTSGANKDAIIEALERLEAGGSTAGGAGLRLAYDVARRHFRRDGNNRVILATDGDFNVGESSDAGMIRLIEDKRQEGTFLTVLGFGTGNLQNEKMQSIAQHGNGNYGYIDSLDEARKILVGEMGGTLVTVAKDVKIQIEFNPAQVRAYRLLGYENRLLANEDFNDDEKDAGEMGAGHTVTALYEVVLVGSESDVGTPGVDPLRYQTPRDDAGVRGAQGAGRAAADSDELAFVRVRYKEANGTESRLLERPVGTTVRRASDDFEFAAAVAGFGMLLRDSEYRGSFTAHQVLSLAQEGLGQDADGYRRGFLQLVRAYQELSVGTDREEAGM
jgi:Ca-activated chloride channel family protein